MARVRRQAGWKQSGDVADFLPQEREEEAQEEVDGWDGTIHHAKNMARLAAARIHFRGASFEDLADEALSGVMMQLAEKPDSSTYECIESGARAARDHASSIMKGRREDGKHTGGGFARYWAGRQIQIDNYHLEELALAQVWDALEEVEQETLTLTALHKSTADASKHAGVSLVTMHRRTRKARKRFLELLFDWETPPVVKNVRRLTKTHCPQGHPYSSENTSYKKGTRDRVCKECTRIRSQQDRDKRKKNEQEEKAA